VLGGFDQATRRDVLRRIAGLMPSDGTLILGAGEPATGFADGSRPLFERGVRVSNSTPDAARPRLKVVGAR
jgi:chemotaxis protein methyltransferase CheR